MHTDTVEFPTKYLCFTGCIEQTRMLHGSSIRGTTLKTVNETSTKKNNEERKKKLAGRSKDRRIKIVQGVGVEEGVRPMGMACRNGHVAAGSTMKTTLRCLAWYRYGLHNEDRSKLRLPRTVVSGSPFYCPFFHSYITSTNVSESGLLVHFLNPAQCTQCTDAFICSSG